MDPEVDLFLIPFKIITNAEAIAIGVVLPTQGGCVYEFQSTGHRTSTIHERAEYGQAFGAGDTVTLMIDNMNK